MKKGGPIGGPDGGAMSKQGNNELGGLCGKGDLNLSNGNLDILVFRSVQCFL